LVSPHRKPKETNASLNKVKLRPRSGVGYVKAEVNYKIITPSDFAG